jgi:aspartyl-tRNA synthetase
LRVFEEALSAGGRVVGLAAPGMAGTSRARIDELTEVARRAGAPGLIWLALDEAGELRGSILKVVGDERARALVEAAGGGPGDLVLIVADADIRAQEALGIVRVRIAEDGGLVDPDVLSYVWIHRFPMYAWDEENKRWDATHNPFSAVVPEDEALLATTSGDLHIADRSDPAGRALALQYDLALNGWELGGGSVRFHSRALLSRSFSLMGHTLEQQQARFGGILEAFDYGAPPHGGIALGIDRWAALLTRQTNIREVMAFPKTSSGSDLMLDAPSPVEPGQLAELGLRFVGTGRQEPAPSAR